VPQVLCDWRHRWRPVQGHKWPVAQHPHQTDEHHLTHTRSHFSAEDWATWPAGLLVLVIATLIVVALYKKFYGTEKKGYNRKDRKVSRSESTPLGEQDADEYD